MAGVDRSGAKPRRATASGVVRTTAWVVVAVCATALLLNIWEYIKPMDGRCGVDVSDVTDESFGDPGWSWFPPGQTCTYPVSLSSATTETTPLTTRGSWYLVSTLLLGGLCVALLLVGRRDPRGASAGWYTDPEGSGRQRYWDGQAWQDVA